MNYGLHEVDWIAAVLGFIQSIVSGSNRSTGNYKPTLATKSE